MPTDRNLRTRAITALARYFAPDVKVETPDQVEINNRISKYTTTTITQVAPPYRTPDSIRVTGTIVRPPEQEIVVQDRQFGPNKPIPASQFSAEQNYGPRVFPYTPGYNLQRQPRQEKSTLPLEPYPNLIYLATEFPIVAICTGARMEEMSSQPWSIVPTDPDDESPQTADLCKEIQEFWQSPDQEQSFEGWISELVAEQITIDVNCLYPRLTRGKRLYSLDIIAGETIKIVADGAGRAAGYQQYLYGRAMGDYSKTDARGFPVESKYLDDTFKQHELIVESRWKRPRTLYGFPPTEWITSYINTAIAKIDWDEKWFTDGNIPDLFMSPPGDMLDDPIALARFEEQFNAIHQANTAMRRKLHVMPFNGNFYQPKPFSYDNAIDKWIFFVVCAAMGIPPSELGYVEDVNRANGEVQERLNRKRGLDPMKMWYAAFLTRITQKYWNTKRVKFQYNPIIDPPTIVDVEKSLLNGIISRDEARKIVYPFLKGPAPKIEDILQYQIMIQKGKVVEELKDGKPLTPESTPALESKVTDVTN